ncbi:hypothetical protein HPB48_001899 [Haemaphysalis longicornis]|uniref:ATP-dependent DNA helicase n=1 Tax=Haemaphysalis longicornis TaxID=44386 RepID=A0A9J6FV43_HAELO|nr:hypothetical protein HPB48_001899 [Haemaphysalis longicornis]
MMSADELEVIDMRLRQITQNVLQEFGGLDMILCCGLGQLPAVRASEIYKHTKNANRVFASNVKWHTVLQVSLVQVVRQKDANLSIILTKVRDGVALERDKRNLIESRVATPAMATILAPDDVRLYYSKEAVSACNVALIKGDPDSDQILALYELRGRVTESDRK